MGEDNKTGVEEEEEWLTASQGLTCTGSGDLAGGPQAFKESFHRQAAVLGLALYLQMKMELPFSLIFANPSAGLI